MNKEKQTLVEALREAMIKEELAIPLYVSHIGHALFWSGLPEEKQNIIIEKLTLLETESEFHAKSLKKLLKKYSAK